jgi:hypothetical protein
MPKEKVYGLPSPSHDEGPATPENTGVAEVRWHRESELVQLVTRADGYEVLLGNESAEVAVKHGYYVALDRRGINDLIRKLRRARDNAFGRDE